MPKCSPSRWRTTAVSLAMIVVAVLALCVSAVRICQAAGPKVISAGPDNELNAAFDTYGDSGMGWTGGDSTWSTRLPDGRELFAFSDTFLAPITRESRPPEAVFVHNSFVIRDADGTFSTVVGGTASRPDSLIRPTNPENWFWLGDASYLNGLLQVPLIELRSTGAGSMDFASVASALAVFAPSDLKQPLSITALPSARGIQWGQWIQSEDDWTYVYGVEDRDRQRHLHIARVSGHDLRQPFAFWTGSGWSPDEDASVRVIGGVGPELSVHRLESGQYLLTSMEDGLGTRLLGRFGPSATGPFGAARTLYVTPETGVAGSYRDADVYTYNAHAHPELSTANYLVVSYNVNSIDNALDGDIFRDVSIYRPRFIGVRLDNGVAQQCFAA